MPFLINGVEVDIATPPGDRRYRGAWVLDGEVVRVDPRKAGEIAFERIKLAAADKRREIDRGKTDANDLKGILALNARDDAKPREQQQARQLLDAYASARGQAGWQAVADQIIAARNAWTAKIMALETLEEAAWRALQAAKTVSDVEQIEAQIIDAMTGV